MTRPCPSWDTKVRPRLLRSALVLCLLSVIAAAQPHRETVLAWSSSHSKYKALRGFRHWPSLPLFAAEVTAAEKRTLAADPSIQLLATQQIYRTATNPGLATAGFPAVWDRGYTGTAAPVAMVDTGVWAGHPEFQNVQVEGKVFLDAGKKHPCFDDDDSTPRDLQGHGTRTASILLSAAPGLERLYSLKAGFKPKSATAGCPTADGILLSTDIFDALDYAVRNTPAKVINLSLGAPAQGDDDLMAKVMDYVVETYGVTLVFSAGNSGADAPLNSPGISYNGITVANLDAQGNVHFSSTRGPTPALRRKPDLSAVGVAIPAADAFSTGTTVATGTSASAPLVSAAAALLREAGIDDPLAVKALLLNSTGQQSWRNDSGWGPLHLDTAFPTRFETIAAQGPRYFSATFLQPARGTLVWNRSVNTANPEGPSPLRPVTLIAYQRGVEVARTGPEANGNVLRLDLPAGDYTLQVATASEAYAMAWNQPGIANVAAPSIALTCAYAGAVTVAQPVQISCTASNTGGLPLSNVTGTLLAPLSFGSGGPQSFGTLAPGASRTISWTVNAATAPGLYTLSANATANGFGANLMVEASPMPPIQVTAAANPPTLFPVVSTGAPVEIRNAGPQPWTIRSLPAFVTATVNGTKIEFQQATASGTGTYTVSNGATTLTGVIAVSLAPVVPPSIGSARLVVQPSMSVGCPLPEAISVVSEAAVPAIWFQVRNVRKNDRAMVRWLRPSGAVAAQSSLSMPDDEGAFCFSATAPSLAGTLGTWTAEVYWNGVKQAPVRFEVRQRIAILRDPVRPTSLHLRFLTLGQPDSTRFVYIEPGSGERLPDPPQAPLAGEWNVEVYLDHALVDTVPVTIAAPVAVPYAEVKDDTLYWESDRELQVQFIDPSGVVASETTSAAGIVPLPDGGPQGLWQARLIAGNVTVRIVPFTRLPFPIYSAAMDREQYSPHDKSATLVIDSAQPLETVYIHKSSGRQVKSKALRIAGGTGARYTGKWEARAVNADGVVFAKVPFEISGPEMTTPAADGTAWAPAQP